MRRYYIIARGSAAELDTLVLLMRELGFSEKDGIEDARERIHRVNLLINGLIRYHDGKLKEGRRS